VLGTVVTQSDPSTSVTVKGVQITRTLPRTGTSSTLPLSQAAVVLVALGLAFLGAARVRREG
jgi:LPXTG-motif cell wall-anchored protein